VQKIGHPEQWLLVLEVGQEENNSQWELAKLGQAFMEAKQLYKVSNVSVCS